MEFSKTENILSSIVDILKHIDEVQNDVVELSERSVLSFNDFIEENSLQPTEKILEVFQYNDIITQQLSAVSDAIAMIEKNIDIYLHAVKHDQNALGDSIDKISVRLIQSLKKAKEKQQEFSGNVLKTQYSKSVEFF